MDVTSESTAWRVGVLVCLACLLAGCGAPGATTDTATTRMLDTSTGPVGEIVSGPGTTTGGTSADATADGRTVTITEVIDGDTMDVTFADGTIDTIRLLGVDTPEVHVETQPEEFEGVSDTDSGRAWLSQWGDRASAFARERLAHRQVTVATSERADRRGSYDRLLVVLRVNGTSFNRALLEGGYARVYDGRFATAAGFDRVEARARKSNTGLWGFGVNASS